MRPSSIKRRTDWLVTWRDGRGFGFIRPDDRDGDVFVPLRAFDRAGLGYPREGMRLSFTVGIDRDGRPCAEVLDNDADPAAEFAATGFMKAR